MGVLRVLMFLLRLIFGVTFILSGYFKLTDPVGTGLIVEEYLGALHMDFLRPGAVVFGAALSLTEFLIGIAVLMCVRMRAASTAGLLMTVFFTVLTFFMALYDAIGECGCFGEAIPLTMWETFAKNVVLIICIVPVFLFRRKFKPVAPAPAEWAFLGTYGVLALVSVIYSCVNLPLMDFGNFRVGSNLSARLDKITDTDNFETYFVYEKDGEQQYFGLDDLPDTSWHYVSSESVYLGDDRDLLFDMTLSTRDGDIVTENLINSRVPEFIFVVLRPGDLSPDYWDKVSSCIDSVSRYGGLSYVAAPEMDPAMDSVLVQYPGLEKSMLYGDGRTLIAMVRSNGGVMLVHNGIVVKKWAARRFSPGDVPLTFSLDTEEITAREIISRRLFYESSILLLFLIIIIFRYVCGIIYGRRFSRMWAITAAASKRKRREARELRRLRRKNKKKTTEDDPQE